MAARSYACPNCKGRFRVLSNQADKMVRCPHCGEHTAIPTILFAAPDHAPRESRSAPPDNVVSSGFTDTEGRPTAHDTISHSIPARRSHATYRGLAGLSFTHSALAQRVSGVGVTLGVLAAVIQVYLLATAEWHVITNLPLRVALPMMALLFAPAAGMIITSLLLVSVAHCVEYLARLAATALRQAPDNSKS